VSSSATLWGVAAGYAAVFVCYAAMSPADSATQGPPASRVLAAMLAITATMAGQRLLRAMHPPGAATTLLIAFGSFSATSRDLTALNEPPLSAEANTCQPTKGARKARAARPGAAGGPRVEAGAAPP
jgi:hypothetical protein